MSKNKSLGCYIKNDCSFSCLYKVKITKNLIIISIALQLIVANLNNMLGCNCLKDVHFSYPSDGDYHQSFKNENKGSKRYITGRYLKTTDKHFFSSDICKKKYERDGQDIFNMFVSEKVCSFEELRHDNFFQFPMLCLSFSSFEKHALDKKNTSVLVEDNILIDSIDLKNKHLCVSGFLMGKNYNWEKFLPSSDVKYYFRSCTVKDLRVLLLARID